MDGKTTNQWTSNFLWKIIEIFSIIHYSSPCMPVYAINKRARFDYEILDTTEAGLVLTGGEVKSIREKSVRLTGSFVTFHGNGAFLINFHIPRYKKSDPSIPHDSERSKKLLLKKKQIDFLRGKSQEQGLTIIPLSVYTQKSRIKVEVGVARGKKKYNKREKIRKRDLDRDDAREKKSRG